MSTNRSRRIDPDTAEQLLGGAVVGTSAGQAPLAGHTALAALLAAAASPVGGDAELPGEEAALAAFREAGRSPVHEPRRRAMAGTAPRRTFNVKALRAAFAITAIGAVAVAAMASTGTLPSVLGGSPVSDTSPVAHGPGAGPSSAKGLAGVTRSPGTDDDGRTTAGGTGLPTPSGTGSDHSSADPDHPGAPTDRASSGNDGQGNAGQDNSGPAKDKATLE